MSDILRVRWTITSQTLPEPWLSCSRCDSVNPFRCSGKFRLNANGKRLDAWLIYRCVVCDETWNRPLFERRQVKEIEPGLLKALEANDRDCVRRFAFDVAGLRAFTKRIAGVNDIALHKEVLSAPPTTVSRLEIDLVLSGATPMRLDRLLAAELGLSRGRIDALRAEGRLAVLPGGEKMLRRPLRDGSRLILQDVPDAMAAILIAAV